MKHGHDQTIHAAKSAVYDDDMAALARLFPSVEHWRLYQDYRDEAAFLDIETGPAGDVSMVGVFDGRETRTFVQGVNLDRQTLLDELERYKLLVTFNGKSFDVPVLKKWFRIPFDLPHVDLRHVCASLGLVGGLKAIEKTMEIKRPESIKHVTGQDAAELWRCWKATRDKGFFDMLVTYNEEDCVNLKTIADRVVPQLWHLRRNAFNQSPLSQSQHAGQG